MRLFIIGGACVGTYLAKPVSSYLIKTFSLHSGSPDKLKILLLAPTDVAATNVDAKTINTGLSINPNTPSFLAKMSYMIKSKLRCDYLEAAFIVIEISMVSNIKLLNIHKRLYEIFGCSEELTFASKSVIAVGDLLQLPPIRASPIYTPYNSVFGDLFKLWYLFLMCELTEVMRQQGDTEFITLLNNLRVGIFTERDKEFLETKKTTIDQFHDGKVLFAEIMPKENYNNNKLNDISHNK